MGSQDWSSPKQNTSTPTEEVFHENVKRAHLQAMVWLSTPCSDPQNLDSTDYGWNRDEQLRSLVAIGIPPGIVCATSSVLDLTKCSCFSDKPCSNYRCGCVSAQLACTMFCKCSDKCCVLEQTVIK